jgi:hypothetical protein
MGESAADDTVTCGASLWLARTVLRYLLPLLHRYRYLTAPKQHFRSAADLSDRTRSSWSFDAAIGDVCTSKQCRPENTTNRTMATT